MASVQLEKLRKVYPNGQTAVEGASFSVADGELVVLVGPSGCGKSTVLRMVAGLESITSGTLRIGDRVVNHIAPSERDIAMVFQSYALYPHMSVAGNLEFGLRLRGTDRATIEARVRAAAHTLQIEHLLERKPAELSGGQRQRVALGRALVRQPQVFLLDEPLSNLDAKLRMSMRVEIARLHRRLGATMIYVTHDQVEAMTLGQRIVVLDAGVIQQIDTPMALYERPVNRFVATFLGTPATNLLRGRLVAADGLRFALAGGQHLSLAGNQVAAELLDREIEIGVRPEHLLRDTDHVPTGFAPIVDVVEPIGNEVLVYLSAGPHNLIARLPPGELPHPGSAMPLRVAPGTLMVFDAASGLRLHPHA